MRQRQHRMLGRGIGRPGHLGDDAPGPGGHIDDAAILLLLHERQDSPHHFDRNCKVDGKDLIPDLVSDSVGAAEVVHHTSDVD